MVHDSGFSSAGGVYCAVLPEAAGGVAETHEQREKNIITAITKRTIIFPFFLMLYFDNFTYSIFLKKSKYFYINAVLFCE